MTRDYISLYAAEAAEPGDFIEILCSPDDQETEILRHPEWESDVFLRLRHYSWADSPAHRIMVVESREEWAYSMGRDHFGLWSEIAVEPSQGEPVIQRLRWIEPGTFLMGSPEDEPERWDNEGPQHPVTISLGFWLFDTACTQVLWQAVMGDNPSRFKGANHPVETVSWNDCQNFLKRLKERLPELNLTLPTEAQWEYACRAGTTTPFSFGSNITSDQANYDGYYPYASGKKGLYRRETVPVASLPPNAWGLYEMHGNVWEWCQDDMRDYTDAPMTDPVGALTPGGARVLRGGSWDDDAGGVRAACRDRSDPGNRGGSLGFRAVINEQSEQSW